MYHVSSESRRPSLTRQRRDTFALASVTDGRLATHTARTLTDMEFHFDKVNPDDLNVRVNPLMSESPVDRGSGNGGTPVPESSLNDIHDARRLSIHKAHRLDAETCRKEGIFFDEEDDIRDEVDNAVEATEDPTVSPHDIIAGILREMVDSIVKTNDDVRDDTESTYDDTSSMSSVTTSVTLDQTDDATDDIKESLLGVDSTKHSAESVVVDDLFSGADACDAKPDPESPDSSQIHPLHTHILLYSQRYDAQRTLYALSTFKSMLAASPKLVCAMATTSVCNEHSQHLEELHKLLIRHRRSVFGRNFFGDVGADASLSGYHSNMYVEVLISICLYFVRSYYPNLMRSRPTTAELEANKQVRNRDGKP